jgi:NtrC-family two-component system response regulator AlgB
MAEKTLQSSRLRILVIDDEETIRVTLSLCLEADGHEVVAHATAAAALAAVMRRAFDLIFLDLRLGTDNGLDLIGPLLAENPWAKIVVITAYASVDTAVEAMKRGASDYLPKPFTPTQVELLTNKVAQQRQIELQLEALQQAMGRSEPEADFPTGEPAMRAALDLARRVAATNVAILIRGEVGTGRERLARAIHVWSGRGAGPFATANCQTNNPEELEAELYGGAPARGAAVEAVNSGAAPATSPSASGGRVAFCEGGTLLLKEVAEMPLSLQPKLVRLLRDHEYERQGEFTPRRADVRVIATSSVDLHAAAREGVVRPDLAAALDVLAIDLPPLRERPNDIPLLAARYLAHFAKAHARPPTRFSNDAMDALKRHSYPGNSLELRNLVERAVLICRGDQIELQNLPPNLLNSDAYHVGDLVPLEKITDLHIQQVLASTRSFESAASVLGINSITLWRRRKRHAT